MFLLFFDLFPPSPSYQRSNSYRPCPTPTLCCADAPNECRRCNLFPLLDDPAEESFVKLNIRWKNGFFPPNPYP